MNATTHPDILEAGPMLFADCPFCLGPMPVDAATGRADCPACATWLELAWASAPSPAREETADPAPEVALAPAA